MANITTAAEENLIKNANLATARQIDFVSSFGYSTKKLMELLGVMRLIPKQAGTLLKRHTVTGTLQSGAVPEGEIIPLSQYTTTDTPIGEITLDKWRKATSAEAILDKGYDQAVNETRTKMLQDIQTGIRSGIISSLTISGQPTVTGVGIQSALAQLVQGKTLLVIAHRLSTIADADQIIVVNQGRIEATGTQEALLASCPLYQPMWEAHISVKDNGEVA